MADGDCGGGGNFLSDHSGAGIGVGIGIGIDRGAQLFQSRWRSSTYLDPLVSVEQAGVGHGTGKGVNSGIGSKASECGPLGDEVGLGRLWCLPTW